MIALAYSPLLLLAAGPAAGFLGGLLLAAAVALLLRARRERRRRAFFRHVQILCGLDAGDLAAEQLPPQVSPLDADTLWQPLAERLRQSFQKHCRRATEAEHTRAVSEVRARRFAAELDQFKRIFAGLPDPVLAVDQYNELLLANSRAEQLFQFNSAQSEERALDRLLNCERLVHLLTATTQHKSMGVRTDELEVAGPDGLKHWYRVTALKLQQEAAADVAPADGGLVAVLRDISDQKVLQKRNAEFVSSVSHEMKTPLAGIKAYVELLVDGDAEDEATREEFLTVINGQADRLQRLVDNLLNLARIEAGVVNVNKQQRSLNEVLEEAAGVVQPSAEAKNIELVRQLSPLYLGVLADRDMLLQAAINLLSNAIKYTRPGGRVTLASRLADDQAQFEVADTGVGLSPEDAVRVFEKFYRVKKDKDMAQGTGLGLPLAKHIVEDVHGGRLTLESTPGVGSTFRVTMPSAEQMN